jgi:uncharacterized membrane-anchored protein YitT (DUF2179 family)
MSLQNKQFRPRAVSQVIWNLMLLITGSVLCAMAINGLLIPNKFVSGGLTGLALVIHYAFPFLPVAWLYFFLNVPMFAAGRLFVGKRFFYYSIAGMCIFTAALKLVDASFPLEEPILSALLAGIISGFGSGIILRSHGSAGGTDILSVIFVNWLSIRVGTTVLVFNSVILLAAAIFTSLQGALYTLIYLYVTSYVMNLVVTGLSKRKTLFIISSRWEEISQEILHRIRRGVTLIHGQGGFSGQQENILYTVVAFQELARVKRLIRKIDPDAFVVITDTLEVIGHRIGNQPHW